MFKNALLCGLFLAYSLSAWAASYVNDGSINWDGNWQTTSQVSALHSSTNLNVDSTTTQYSVGWSASTSNTDLGAVLYLTSITTNTTGRTITVSLQQADDSGFTTNLIDQASTTLITDSTTQVTTWLYFKYGSSFTELSGKYYRIKVASDNAADTGFRADNVSTTKVAVLQVLSATGTLAGGDHTYINGIVQGTTGNPSVSTVTMNINNSSTVFGSINIGNGGKMAYGTSASTTYYLKINSTLKVGGGGEFDIGTSSTPMPNSSSGTLEFTAAAANSIAYGGTLSLQGEGFANNLIRTTLADDISPVSDRTFTTTDDIGSAGWSSTDMISVSGTNFSPGTPGTELKTTTTISGTSITIDSDWARTHLLGAEVLNFTRPVTLKSASTSNNVYFDTYGTVDVDYAYFGLFRGSNAIFNGINFTSTIMPSINVDYSVFNSCGFAISFNSASYQTPLPTMSLTLTGNIIYGYSGLIYSPPGYILIDKTSHISPYIYNSGVFVSSYSGQDNVRVKVTNSNIYSFGIATLFNNINYVVFDNCKFWDSWAGYGGTFPRYTGFFSNNGMATIIFKNSKIGSDGTNNISIASLGTSSDVFYLYNTSVNLVQVPVYQPDNAEFTNFDGGIAYMQDYNGVAGKYKSYLHFGDVSDQVTGGQTGSWARGGSGQSIYLNPTKTTVGQTLNLSFKIPVTASTNPQITFYVKTTQTSSGPTLNVDVYDTNNSTILVNNASVTLTSASDWTQYSVASISPSSTGFVRVVLKALNGSSTGDVGIDDVSFVSGGTTYTDSCDRSADGLPLIFGTAAAGPGGASTHASGMAF